MVIRQKNIVRSRKGVKTVNHGRQKSKIAKNE